MKLFDQFIEKSEITKKIVEAVETSTKLLKDISALCDSITKRLYEQQTEINQIYLILETMTKQGEFDQQIDEIRQTTNKKDIVN